MRTLRQEAAIATLRRRHSLARLLPFVPRQRCYAASCPLVGAGTAGRMWRQRQCRRYPYWCAQSLGDAARGTLAALVARVSWRRG
jgi:hypothetical protein